MNIVNVCSLYLRIDEDAHYLFIHSPFAKTVWLGPLCAIIWSPASVAQNGDRSRDNWHFSFVISKKLFFGIVLWQLL